MDVRNIAILAGPLDVDGPSSRTFDIARELIHRGRRVELISSGGPMVTKFYRAGIPVYLHRAARTGWLNRLCVHSLLEHVRQFEPHVIHCQTALLSGLAAKLARACRCVYVVSSNSRADTELRIRRTSRFRGIIASHESVRGYLVNNEGVPKRFITVIPDGIDIDDAPVASNGEHITVVGMIAPLRRGEGHEDFLDAARILANRIDEIQFIVAGSGPMLRQLRRKVAELGIERRATFAWKYGEYRTVLNALDMLVVPTTRDLPKAGRRLSAYGGNARLVLEAIACRKPVIATGAGSLTSIIKDGETGMLVHKGSPGEIAEAVAALIKNPSLGGRITAEAARWVREHHNLAQMIERTLDVYDRAANRELV